MPLERRRQGARPILPQPQSPLKIRRSLEKAADLDQGDGARGGAGDGVGDPELAMPREIRLPPVAGGEIERLELRRRAARERDGREAGDKSVRLCQVPPSAHRVLICLPAIDRCFAGATAVGVEESPARDHSRYLIQKFRMFSGGFL